MLNVDSSVESATDVSAAHNDILQDVKDDMKEKVRSDSKYEPSKPLMTLIVGDPEAKGGTFSKYYNYQITTNPPQPVSSVHRKFKEFEWLRDSLVRTFPGLFLPPLPPSKLLGSLVGPELAITRRVELERFLNRLATIAVVVNSQCFKTFIGQADHFDEAMKTYDKKLDTRSMEELLNIYKDLFSDQMSYNITDQAETEINAWGTFLTQCDEKLTAATEMATTLAEIMQQQFTNLSKFQPLALQMEAVEKGFANMTGVVRLDISETFTQWTAIAKIQEVSHSQHLLSAFKQEAEDIRAFLELLKIRKDVFSQADKAISKAKKWKSPDTQVTTDKLKKEKEMDEKKEEQLKSYLDSMTKLILAQQATVFWREKTLQFKKSIAAFAKDQIQSAKQATAIFEKLHDEANPSQ